MEDELLLDFVNEASTIEANIKTARERYAYHDERMQAWSIRLNKLTTLLSIIKKIEETNESDNTNPAG